jgi:hypothetical protein
MITKSCTPSSLGSDVQRTGALTVSPSIIRRAPCSRIAARCAPRAIKLTSAPARANCTPIKPPIAPAPKMQIFMMPLL